ncbi:hypothetical protein BDW02DRAFT_93625 [Decorospora gaudefroyi]|uniref:RNase III domain-containing protein n=1 Tax=Decorospora gaudefroyi TaxID=184978 RepID=A0A6A5K0Z1_9PLEO|nr:hypothetical protein BDW02DRAFT_93625 [Decorospora gaudefroyi]
MPLFSIRNSWTKRWRRFRHQSTSKVFGLPSPITRQTTRMLKTGSKSKDKHRGQSLAEQLLRWLQGEQRQHFGPKARIPDLFQRRDQVYLALESQQLQWYTLPPVLHHDLLHAAAKVGHIEERIGYIFKDKMTCIEALKVTSPIWPLYFKGVTHKIDKNNRLALLGDRVLSLALCDIWFHTGNSPGDYSMMERVTETRAALYVTGKSFGLHQNLLLSTISPTPTNDQIAEAVEAIIGAVYVDSGNSVSIVQRVLTQMELDTHRNLKSNPQAREEQEQKDLERIKAAEDFDRRNQEMLARARRLSKVRERENRRKSQREAEDYTLKDTIIAPQVDTKHSEVTLQKLQSATRLEEVATSKKLKSSNKLSMDGSLLAEGSNRKETVPIAEVQPSSPKPQFEKQDRVQATPEPPKQSPPAVAAMGVTTSQLVDSQQQTTSANTAAAVEQKIPTRKTPEQKQAESRAREEENLKRMAWLSASAKAKRLGKKGKSANVKSLYQGLVLEMLANFRRRLKKQKRMEKMGEEAKMKHEAHPEEAIKQELGELSSLEAAKTQKEEQLVKEPVTLEKTTRQASSDVKKAQPAAADPPANLPSGDAKKAQPDPPANAKASEKLVKGQDRAQQTSQPKSSPVLFTKASEAREAPAPIKDSSKSSKAQNPATNVAKSQSKESKDAEASSKSVKQLEKEIMDSHIDVWQGVATSTPDSVRGTAPKQLVFRRVFQKPGTDKVKAKEPLNEHKETPGSKSKLQVKLEETNTNAKPVVGVNELDVEGMKVDVLQDERKQQDTTAGKGQKAQAATEPTVKPVVVGLEVEKALGGTTKQEARQKKRAAERMEVEQKEVEQEVEKKEVEPEVEQKHVEQKQVEQETKQKKTKQKEATQIKVEQETKQKKNKQKKNKQKENKQKEVEQKEVEQKEVEQKESEEGFVSQPKSEIITQPDEEAIAEPGIEPTIQPGEEVIGNPEIESSTQPTETPLGEPTAQLENEYVAQSDEPTPLLPGNGPPEQPTEVTILLSENESTEQPTEDPTERPEEDSIAKSEEEPSLVLENESTDQPTEGTVQLPENGPASPPEEIPISLPKHGFAAEREEDPTLQLVTPTAQSEEVLITQPEEEPKEESIEPPAALGMQPKEELVEQPEEDLMERPDGGLALPLATSSTEPTEMLISEPEEESIGRPPILTIQPKDETISQPENTDTGLLVEERTLEPATLATQPEEEPVSQPVAPSKEPEEEPTKQREEEPIVEPATTNTQPQEEPIMQSEQGSASQPAAPSPEVNAKVSKTV